MTPMPQCETVGLINLCAPASLIEGGAKVDTGHGWITLQVPNLIWYLAVLALIILAIYLPFPAKEVDTTGYDLNEGGSK